MMDGGSKAAVFGWLGHSAHGNEELLAGTDGVMRERGMDIVIVVSQMANTSIEDADAHHGEELRDMLSDEA